MHVSSTHLIDYPTPPHTQKKRRLSAVLFAWLLQKCLLARHMPAGCSCKVAETQCIYAHCMMGKKVAIHQSRHLFCSAARCWPCWHACIYFDLISPRQAFPPRSGHLIFKINSCTRPACASFHVSPALTRFNSWNEFLVRLLSFSFIIFFSPYRHRLDQRFLLKADQSNLRLKFMSIPRQFFPAVYISCLSTVGEIENRSGLIYLSEPKQTPTEISSWVTYKIHQRPVCAYWQTSAFPTPCCHVYFIILWYSFQVTSWHYYTVLLATVICCLSVIKSTKVKKKTIRIILFLICFQMMGVISYEHRGLYHGILNRFCFSSAPKLCSSLGHTLSNSKVDMYVRNFECKTFAPKKQEREKKKKKKEKRRTYTPRSVWNTTDITKCENLSKHLAARLLCIQQSNRRRCWKSMQPRCQTISLASRIWIWEAKHI